MSKTVERETRVYTHGELLAMSNELGKVLYESTPEIMIPQVIAAAFGGCLGNILANFTYEERGEFWRLLEMQTVHILTQLVVPEGATKQ